jgi:type IV fimbrial biogenesis protein FimT
MRLLSRQRADQPPVSAVPSGGRCRSLSGFTLVELMITIAVAAILLVIAVPSFRNIMASNQLTTAANEIVGAIHVARMEAVKRNASTQFCSDSAANNTGDTLGAACTTGSGAIYVLTGGTPATVKVRDAVAGLKSPVQLSGHITAIRFNGQGLGYQAGNTSTPYNGTVADICTSTTSTDNHRVITMTTGTIITVASSQGTCP